MTDNEAESNATGGGDESDGFGKALMSCFGAKPLEITIANPQSQSPVSGGSTAYVLKPEELTARLAKRKTTERHNGFVKVDAESDLKKPYGTSRRGYCLLINQKNFDSALLKTRHGTDIDAEDVSLVFLALGFKVFVYRDLDKKEFRQKVDEFAKKDHSQCDLFVCVVLSHGEDGKVYAKKGGTIDVERELVGKFCSDTCKSLVGKPKLFFVNACRGDQPDRGLLAADDGERIPTLADVFIFYAVYPGFTALRNLDTGSWFVQALCDVLQKYVVEYDPKSNLPQKSLDELADLTKMFISKRLSSDDFGPLKQVPVTVSTLRRPFYFALPGEKSVAKQE